MNGIITISDGIATMENGNLTNVGTLDANTITLPFNSIPDSYLSTNVPLKDASNTFINTNNFNSITNFNGTVNTNVNSFINNAIQYFVGSNSTQPDFNKLQIHFKLLIRQTHNQ